MTLENVIELLKVILTWPVASVIIVWKFYKPLSKWIDNLIISGEHGGTHFTLQSVREEGASIAKKMPNIENPETPMSTEQPAHGDDNSVHTQAENWRSIAYIWEYRYLNYYLVHNTKKVLYWFSTREFPINYTSYNAYWMTRIPDIRQRETILNVLQNHYLILRDGDTYSISPKGLEYIQFRDGKI